MVAEQMAAQAFLF